MTRRARLAALLAMHLWLQHGLDEVLQGPVVLLADQVKLPAEEHVMFQAGIEVALQAELRDLVEVVAVDVRVDAQEALEDGLDQVGELLRERRADLGREDVVVVEEVLDPVHQVLHVLARGQQHGLLQRNGAVGHQRGVLPQVLVLVGGDHARARLRRAELGDGAVQHVDLVVEVHHVHRQPLVDVLALGKLDRADERVVRPQRLLGVAADVLVRGDVLHGGVDGRVLVRGERGERHGLRAAGQALQFEAARGAHRVRVEVLEERHGGGGDAARRPCMGVYVCAASGRSTRRAYADALTRRRSSSCPADWPCAPACARHPRARCGRRSHSFMTLRVLNSVRTAWASLRSANFTAAL